MTHHLLKGETDRVKRAYYITQFLESFRTTCFRQTMFAEFEMKAHRMAESGEPLTVDILYNTSDAHRSIAVAIGQMWKQTLGVETTLANQEWQTFLTERGDKNYGGVARAGWCADYNEASSFLDIMQSGSGYNDSGFANEDFDADLAAARTAEDPLPNYVAAEEILMADMPIIPLYFYATVFMMDDAIKGYPLENAQDNWYAKDLYRVASE